MLEPGKNARPKVGTSDPIKVQVVTCAQPAVNVDVQPETKQDTLTFDTATAVVKQQGDTDSELSDIGEDVEIILGGGDETSAWRYNKKAGKWGRVQRSLQPELRLSDVQALPRDKAGGLMSFGSLGHVLNNEPCKVCVFNRKASCRQRWLCNFCHSSHQPYVRARRPQRRRAGECGGSSVHTGSDTQSMASTGTLESEAASSKAASSYAASNRESVFSAVSQQAEPRYVHVVGDSIFTPTFSRMSAPTAITASPSTTFGARSKPSAPIAELPLQDAEEVFHSPRSQ